MHEVRVAPIRLSMNDLRLSDLPQAAIARAPMTPIVAASVAVAMPA